MHSGMPAMLWTMACVWLGLGTATVLLLWWTQVMERRIQDPADEVDRGLQDRGLQERLVRARVRARRQRSITSTRTVRLGAGWRHANPSRRA